MTKSTTQVQALPYIIRYRSAYVTSDLQSVVESDAWSVSLNTRSDPAFAYGYSTEAEATGWLDRYKSRFVRRKQMGDWRVVERATAPMGRTSRGPEAYDAEARCWTGRDGIPSMEDRNQNVPHIKDVVRTLGEHFGIVGIRTEVTTRRSSNAVAYCGQNRLRFSKWCSDVIVCHEVAHLAAGHDAGHRRAWQDKYVEAIGVIYGPELAQRLDEHFIGMRNDQTARRQGRKLPTGTVAPGESSGAVRNVSVKLPPSHMTRSKPWTVSWRIDGKRKRRFFTTETEATEFAATLR